MLADFRNTTGDPDFDLTLRQALALKLAESPFLNVLSDAQMRAAVKRMMLKDDEPITPRIGREICERNGLKAVVTGSIAPVGHAYFLQLEALNCAGGESLARMASACRRSSMSRFVPYHLRMLPDSSCNG